MMGSMAFCISGGKQYRQQRAAFWVGLCICRQHCAVNGINVRKIIRCLLLPQFAVRQLDFRIAVEHGRPCLILSFVLAFILFFMKIPIISANIQVHILGTVCFIIFWRIGKKVMTFANAKTFIMLLSHISYPVFLLQHVVISQIVRNIVWDNLSMTKYLIFLILSGVLIIFQAWMLSMLFNALRNIFLQRNRYCDRLSCFCSTC